ncbi:Sucrose synthase 7 [Apostasia shenzhenica]|uniref:Sucrose synthase 7 n=1 Tax=Apostasia shenzhenica TaxID=1088818 RepID=A0A2I0B9N5_9ASPA|nr:Sucrose synthase 7 [Apostasia shenzhenica]
MEEIVGKEDVHGNMPRLNSIRAPGSIKASLSVKSGSRSSPAFRRLHPSRTPRRDSRSGSGRLHWIRNNRVVFGLTLITLWAYFGFHVQSKWAHGDHKKTDFEGYKSEAGRIKNQEDAAKDLESMGSRNTTLVVKEPMIVGRKKIYNSSVSRLNGNVKGSPRKRGRRMLRRVKPTDTVVENANYISNDVMISPRNTSFGLMVGPFGEIANKILGWSPEKRKGTCDRRGEFARLVWSRSFVLIFHELSMTGAPLSMMELATELLSCGGYVKVVALSKKGGLMVELGRRGIKMLDDKGEISFKAAMKADIVVAGSAVSSSWIEQYLKRNPDGFSQLVWWIMENRQEYYNRSKHMLGQVKMLTFLSSEQSKQWLSWCEQDKIKLKSPPLLVPLSVNDELAFVAGISSSLNTPTFSVEKMVHERELLRNEVRKEMGLSDNDMLVISLSSINPAKGQLLLLEAAHLVAEHNVSERVPLLLEKDLSLGSNWNRTSTRDEKEAEELHLKSNQTATQAKNKHQPSSNSSVSKKRKRKRSRLNNILSSSNQTKLVKQDRRQLRVLMSEIADREEQVLKVLIGSVGSKSNKVPYMKAILKYVSQNSNMSKMVLWTRATTCVAPIYAAADVYIMNAQGVGETFGRVTIEAMAFGLPVLGTDAGGTREIVEDKVTGLLHPLGREGTQTLAQNIQFLLKNPSVRKKMGILGSQKVQQTYLKQQTYSKLAKVFAKCLKVK